MKILPLKIPGLIIIEPDVFGDDRGFFMETWHQKRYGAKGVPETFMQDNLSRSSLGVLRGLHYQHPHSQGKLVTVLEGKVFDVVVDIRRSSPTFGKWEGVELSEENKRQFFIPPGLAHGFEVLSDTALFTYKCTDLYYPENEGTILWNDPDIGITWQTANPILSPKDEKGMLLKDVPPEKLPEYQA
jgi:dTDP-4-dehydrorhamnose 3,5-epimerase